MRVRLCMLLFFAPAVAVNAQVGRLGMSGDHLRERLGEPQAIRPDGDAGEVWLYPGADTLMTFAYYLRDRVIVSTDVLIEHATREAALARLRTVVDALREAGWKVMELNPDNYLFHTGEELYRAFVLRDQGKHILMLTHLRRSDARAVNGRSRTPLLAFHRKRNALDPALVDALAQAAAEEAPPPITFGRPPERMQPPSPPDAVGPPPPRHTYTWVVASKPSVAEAETVAARYREAGHDVTVYAGMVGGRTTYRVGVGQYPSRRALQAARTTLPPWTPGDAWPLRLAPDAVLAYGE